MVKLDPRLGNHGYQATRPRNYWVFCMLALGPARAILPKHVATGHTEGRTDGEMAIIVTGARTKTIILPDEASWAGYRAVLAFGAHGDVQILAWGRGLEDVLDQCVDYMADCMPGMLADTPIEKNICGYGRRNRGNPSRRAKRKPKWTPRSLAMRAITSSRGSGPSCRRTPIGTR